MKRMVPRRLLHQFLVIILAVMGAVLIIQIILLLYIKRQETITSQEYIASIVNSIENTVAMNLTNVERSGFALSYNNDLIKIYSQQFDSQTSITGVLELIKLIYYDNQGEVIDVSLISLSEAQRSLLMGISPEMNAALMELYDFSDKTRTDRKFLFFQPGSEYRGNYYIYVAPLFNSAVSTSGVQYKLATIVFVGELTAVKRAINVVDPETAVLWITDKDGAIVLSNQSEPMSSAQADALIETKIHFQKKISDTDLVIAGALVRYSSIEEQQILQYMLFTMMVFIVTLLILFEFFRNKISIPMNLIRKDLEQVGQYGLNKRMRAYDSEEINHIASWVNSMLDRLKISTEENISTQQKLFETEISKKQAELYSLRNQINPHFLYNTLQCMRGIAIENDVPDLADMATALFDIFRYSIKGGNWTNIQKELHIARQYLSVFEFRYEGNFEFHIQADDAVMELSILKMTLQPIIENSIQHGFSNHQGKMRIDVSVFMEDDFVVIRITDNGGGIAPDRLDEVRRMLARKSDSHLESSAVNSYGLDNINRRMYLTFGEKYSLMIDSLAQGTQVCIKFPAVEYHPESVS